MLSNAQLSTLTIRRAGESDGATVAQLAGLDSARPLAGDVLLAEADDRPIAAIEVVSGRLVADPFRRSATEADLLRTHAEQLRSRSPRARRRNRRGAFRRLAGVAR